MSGIELYSHCISNVPKPHVGWLLAYSDTHSILDIDAAIQARVEQSLAALFTPIAILKNV